MPAYRSPRVDVRPELFRWAAERSRIPAGELDAHFPKLDRWERLQERPTLRQLEAFAKATRAPIGYFFLSTPPVEDFPIPDFRTVASEHLQRPSPDLLDTIYLCQQRQYWYHDYCRAAGEPELSFVGTVQVTSDVVGTATKIRTALTFDVEQRQRLSTWTEALRLFIEQADALGVLVMCSGVVGCNSRRHLDPNEFRGFALSDAYAPLVFINGADTKAAQMFTLAHELAHIWLGQSAVSDVQAAVLPVQAVERWCNQVAAELLVPMGALRKEYRKGSDAAAEARRLAAHFKVSTLVMLRRVHDAGWLTREGFWAEYQRELTRLRRLPKSKGGNFYLSLGARASKRLARAVVISTLNGQTTFTEAFRLLGVKKLSTFDQIGEHLGVGS